MEKEARKKNKIEELSMEEIEEVLKEQKKTHFYKRILFIKYKKEKKTHEQIASLLGVCLKTLSNWMRAFAQGGINQLLDVSYDRRTPKLQKYEEEIRKKVREGEVKSIPQLKKYLEEKFSITLSRSNLQWFLKKNGIILQKNKTYSRRNARVGLFYNKLNIKGTLLAHLSITS